MEGFCAFDAIAVFFKAQLRYDIARSSNKKKAVVEKLSSELESCKRTHSLLRMNLASKLKARQTQLGNLMVFMIMNRNLRRDNDLTLCSDCFVSWGITEQCFLPCKASLHTWRTRFLEQ